MDSRKRGPVFSGRFVVLFAFFILFAFLAAGCASKTLLISPFASTTPGLGAPSSSPASKAGSSAPAGSVPAVTGTAVSPQKEKLLPVKNIQQNPELQSGCEITSAAIVLNYFGFKMTKMDLLPFLSISNDFSTVDGKLRGPSPWKTFVGDPQSERYGCYAPVIADALNNYLLSVGSKRNAYDITGTSPAELYSLVDQGVPVIIWATVSMEAPSPGPEWYLEDSGDYFQWMLKEHSMVLIGFNGTQAIFSDPDDPKGTVSYDRALFEQRYADLYNQAVVIE